MQITVRLINLDNVILGVRKFGAAIPGVTKKTLRGAMLFAHRTAVANWPGGSVQGYNVPARGTYRRTGRYGASSRVVETATGARLEIAAPYAVYVGGDSEGRGQVWFHQGRWPVIREAVEEEVEPLTRQLDRDVQQTVEAVGL